MRNGSEYPILLNRNIIDNPIKKIAVGGCFIHSLTEGGQVYAMGENYKGQLGLGEVSYKQQFTKIPIDECAVDIANGFQHSLILTSNF